MARQADRSRDLAGLEALVRQAVEGCEESFSQLADRFRPRLCVLLDRHLAESRTRLDAEDIVQESLVKAYQNLHRYDSKYRFSTWLYTIAFRTAKDHIRRNRRWIGMLRFGDDTIGASTVHPTNDQEAKDEAANIWALARTILKADQYTALWLRYGDDLEMEEIAQILGKSHGAIRVLLHRSRLKLLEHIQSGKLHERTRRLDTETGGIK